MHPHPLPTRPESLDRLAHKRTGAKLGWYIHAIVYVLVNLFLAFVSSRSGHSWAVFPALGWGLGLLLHGAGVWLAMPGGSLYGRLLDRERSALQRQAPH